MVNDNVCASVLACGDLCTPSHFSHVGRGAVGSKLNSIKPRQPDMGDLNKGHLSNLILCIFVD